MKKIKNNSPSITKKVESFALSATKWIGSPMSLIVHTILFTGAFGLRFFGVPMEEILLTVTTIVSFEAIYLSIFIQMTVNHQAEAIHEVQENIEEIQEDVEEIHDNVEEIQEDVEEIQEDVEEIQEDVEEIHDNVEEIQEDVEEIQEDVGGGINADEDPHAPDTQKNKK